MFIIELDLPGEKHEQNTRDITPAHMEHISQPKSFVIMMLFSATKEGYKVLQKSIISGIERPSFEWGLGHDSSLEAVIFKLQFEG